jgi:2-dehydropantoate 2-reductase
VKFCVYGAGAIGGYLAVRLATAGHDVCVIARGAHLEAIQKRGLTLRSGESGEQTVHVPAADDPRAFGHQDFVICALKAHQAYTAAESFAPLLGPRTAVVTAMNGIPWWYFHHSGGRFEGLHPESVDRDGRQWQAIGPERAIGCVVDPACEVVQPGVILHEKFNKFPLGEPDGTMSERVTALSAAFQAAGFDAPVKDNIRWNIWLKLSGNVCFNPISVLTGATLDRIVGDPALRSLCKTMMLETRAVHEALGVHIKPQMVERRLDAAASVTGHKMSMLQDLERGRTLEIDALVTVVQELGRLTGVATPFIDMVLALVKQKAARLAPDGLRAGNQTYFWNG